SLGRAHCGRWTRTPCLHGHEDRRGTAQQGRRHPRRRCLTRFTRSRNCQAVGPEGGQRCRDLRDGGTAAWVAGESVTGDEGPVAVAVAVAGAGEVLHRGAVVLAGHLLGVGGAGGLPPAVARPRPGRRAAMSRRVCFRSVVPVLVSALVGGLA